MDILKHTVVNERHSVWLAAGEGSAKGQGRTFAEAYWNALDALKQYRSAMQHAHLRRAEAQ